MAKRLKPIRLACLVALLAGPAQAEMQQSRDLILGGLERYAVGLKEKGELKWDEAQTSTSSAGDVIVVPNLRFEASDGAFAIGRIEFTVGEARKAGGVARQQIAMKLSQKMTITSLNGPPVDITFVDNGFTASYAPDLEAVLAMNFSYKDIAIADRGDNGAFRIGEFFAKTDVKEDGNLLSTTVRVALQKISAQGKGAAVEIAEVAEVVSAEKIPLLEWAGISRKIRDTLNGRLIHDLSGDEWMPIIDALQELPGAGGGRVELSLSGMSFKDPSGVAGKLDKGAFGFGLARSGQSAADLTVGLSIEGLDVPIPGVEGDMKDVIPTRGLLDVKLLGLPAERMWQALLDAGREGAQSGPDDFRDALAMQMMEIAHSTDADLRVALTLGAPAMTGDGKSDFKLDADSAFGVVGQARVILGGLDPVLDKIRKSPQNEQTQQAIVVLSMVKGFGKTEVANNAVIYVYDFVLEKAGAMTLNGQDLQQLMNKQQGGAPGQPPQQRQPQRKP
jgi:hypothetical protein